ncbi:SRPBCC family protein [soil metagenome]
MTDTLELPGDAGAIRTLDDGWEIRFERRLRHSPERVWKALTTPEGLACWLAEADIDPRPGGRMALNFRQPDHEFMPDTPDNRLQHNEVLVAEPYTRFEHTFGSNELSVVRWRLTPDGDGTHILLIHSIPQGWAGGRANVLSGWRTHMDGLEDAIHGVRHLWDWDLFLARRAAWSAKL